MRIFLLSLLLLTFAAVGYGQDSKLFAESIRSSERTIKGAPFSAEAQSESTQMLADGNRITHRTASRLFRDSEGRFRREDMPKQIGVPGAVVEVPESILIIDPVAGYRYVINEKRHTMRQSVLKPATEIKKVSDLRSQKAEIKAKQAEQQGEGKAAGRADMAAKAAERKEKREERLASRKADVKFVAKPLAPDSTTKTESLGVQSIDGVNAEGTRTTTTIPAGSIGNEREINIVYEKWYAKDLQLIVMSKHTDPRFGEQTYRLTNIRRDEPQQSLFVPPADYSTVEEKGPKPFTVVMPKVAPLESKPPVPPAAKKP